MTPRLRVGVPPGLTRLPTHSSAGRIWSRVLIGLDTCPIDLVVREPDRRGWRRTRVDVWLSDGHQGPLDVRAPVVAHFHEATWADPALRPLFEPAFLAANERASEAAARAARRLVTVSQASKAQLVTAYGVDASAVHVALNGVDHSTYRPGLTSPAPLLDAAGGDAKVPYVLFVSAVHPRKNLGVLRAAMAALADRGLPHALVLVAGPAADRSDSTALEAAAVAPIAGCPTPVLNLAGIDDGGVARLMAGAAAFCLPSLMEGFGMSAAEAMACGAPVVVSDRGALPEVVGDAGIVVPPEAEAVTAALWSVLSDPDRAATLSRRAVERATRFRWEVTVAGFLEALRAAA